MSKQQRIEELFKAIYGTLVDIKYTGLSTGEIAHVASGAINQFKEKFK